jgi:hypothetical protein
MKPAIEIITDLLNALHRAEMHTDTYSIQRKFVRQRWEWVCQQHQRGVTLTEIAEILGVSCEVLDDESGVSGLPQITSSFGKEHSRH